MPSCRRPSARRIIAQRSRGFQGSRDAAARRHKGIDSATGIWHDARHASGSRTVLVYDSGAPEWRVVGNLSVSGDCARAVLARLGLENRPEMVKLGQ
jgi:hypothetical protein